MSCGNLAVSPLDLYSAWRQHVARLMCSAEMLDACGEECRALSGSLATGSTFIYAADVKATGGALPRVLGAEGPSAAERYWDTPTSELCVEVGTTSRVDDILAVAFNCDIPSAAVLRAPQALHITRLLPVPLQTLIE